MLPRWMQWLFVGFIAYLIFVGSRLPHETVAPQPAPATVVPPITKQDYPALANALDIDRWKRGINPDLVVQEHCGFDNVPRPAQLGMKIITEAAGDGAPAACGDTLSLHITVWNAQGGIGAAGDATITLGAASLTNGIDAGLVGIRPHGSRTIILPPTAMHHAKNGKAPTALLAVLPANKLAMVTIERLK
jgi:hypothetical protein